MNSLLTSYIEGQGHKPKVLPKKAWSKPFQLE